MSAPLVETVLRACIALSGAIDSTIEAKSSVHAIPIDIVSENQSDLVAVYNMLADQLSIDLNLDARQLVRDFIAADLVASRAIIFAQTGLRLSVEAKE